MNILPNSLRQKNMLIINLLLIRSSSPNLDPKEEGPSARRVFELVLFHFEISQTLIGKQEIASNIKPCFSESPGQRSFYSNKKVSFNQKLSNPVNLLLENQVH